MRTPSNIISGVPGKNATGDTSHGGRGYPFWSIFFLPVELFKWTGTEDTLDFYIRVQMDIIFSVRVVPISIT